MKRIIVCCDGTWYAADKGVQCLPSNVARMARAIATSDPDKGHPIPQVVLYQSGVGTGSLGMINKGWQGAFGSGLDDNLSEVYNFIANNYERGDEIFLFGFSRGAYTARAIGGLICDAGLLRPLYMDAYAGMFTFYKARNNSGNGKADWETWLQKASKQKMTIEVPKIKAIGVWDTVGALGLPETFWSSYPGTFHNTKLSSKIEFAFHALALDEHRGAFRPTLWYLPSQKATNGHRDKHETVLEQTWFPGYHSHVGGGTTGGLNSDIAEIDEIAFAWMVDRLQYHGLLDFTTKDVFNSMLSRPMLIENKQVANEWGCGILEDSYGLEYTFAGGSETRSPKATKFNDTVQSGDDVVTNEYIHPSVWHRMEKEKGMKGGWFGGRDGYNPKALEGWTRDDKVKPAVWRKGNLTLEEYMIPEVGKGATGFGSVEKLLMPKSIQKVFVAAEQ